MPTAQPTAEEQLLVQRIAALGWRSETVEKHDAWLLRAHSGWTGRANSALPLTAQPKMASEPSLEIVREFFGRQRLPVKIQVPLPACSVLDEHLARGGLTASDPTHVLTARIEDVLDDGTDTNSVEVEISTAPDKEWFAACERWARELGDVGRNLVSRHHRVGFASVRSIEGDIISTGRVAVDKGWAGLSTSAVHPEHRRRGIATAMLRARLHWAQAEHGATHAYLQVEKHNAASLDLCRKAGFVHHHDYHYRTWQTGR